MHPPGATIAGPKGWLSIIETPSGAQKRARRAGVVPWQGVCRGCAEAQLLEFCRVDEAGQNAACIAAASSFATLCSAAYR